MFEGPSLLPVLEALVIVAVGRWRRRRNAGRGLSLELHLSPGLRDSDVLDSDIAGLSCDADSEARCTSG